MSELETALDALDFFRGWKSTFLAAVDASAQGAKAAQAARGRAEKLLGRLPNAPAVETVSAPGEALATLEACVARLEAFEAAKARRDTWIGWIERATPGGPLADWAAEARRRRPVIERLLVEAEPEALADVRAELDRQLAEVDAIADTTRERLREARGQIKQAVDTFEQAVRILTEDVRRMEERLDRLRGETRAVERSGLVPVLGIGGFTGAVAGMVGWFGGGESGGTWALVAGGGALVAGLAAGLARWGRELGDVQSRLATLDREARELGADLEGARVTVLSELNSATAAWEEAAEDAGELRFDPGRLDTGPAAAKVRDPGVTLPLDGVRSRIATVSVSRRGWQVAAAGVGVCALLVVAAVAGVLSAAIGEPPSEVAGAAAVVAPEGGAGSKPVELVGEPVEAATAGAGTEGAEAGAGAEGAAAARPPPPPPTVASGSWSGTLGLATVQGTLEQDGAKLTGSFTLTEGGAPRTCSAKGSASAGDKVRLTLQGCGSPVRLEGSVKDGGRTLRGKARSTGTGAFAGAEVVDAFELEAQ